MKLRLDGNAIRFRLGPADVDRLVRTGAVSVDTPVGPTGRLVYTLALGDVAEVTAGFDGRELRATIPAADGRAWAADDGRVAIAGGAVLIEKDFQCLHGERSADAYPNPADGE